MKQGLWISSWQRYETVQASLKQPTNLVLCAMVIGIVFLTVEALIY